MIYLPLAFVAYVCCIHILPTGAIYADESDIYIDGDTYFKRNFAEGEPQRKCVLDVDHFNNGNKSEHLSVGKK